MCGPGSEVPDLLGVRVDPSISRFPRDLTGPFEARTVWLVLLKDRGKEVHCGHGARGGCERSHWTSLI